MFDRGKGYIARRRPAGREIRSHSLCIQRTDAALPTRTSAFPFGQALEQVREGRCGRRIAPNKFAKLAREPQELAKFINASRGGPIRDCLNLVLHCHLIKTSIIDAHAQGAVRLRHKQNRGAVGRARLFDPPIVLCCFDLLFDLYLFLGRQPKRRPVMRH